MNSRSSGYGCSCKGSADGDGHGLGREAEKFGLGRQAILYGPCKAGFVGVGGQAFQRLVDEIERVGGLEEKIAAQAYVGQLAVLDIKIDDHQLAARNFVFS